MGAVGQDYRQQAATGTAVAQRVERHGDFVARLYRAAPPAGFVEVGRTVAFKSPDRGFAAWVGRYHIEPGVGIYPIKILDGANDGRSLCVIEHREGVMSPRHLGRRAAGQGGQDAGDRQAILLTMLEHSWMSTSVGGDEACRTFAGPACEGLEFVGGADAVGAGIAEDVVVGGRRAFDCLNIDLVENVLDIGF